jgi:hypothetical protein
MSGACRPSFTRRLPRTTLALKDERSWLQRCSIGWPEEDVYFRDGRGEAHRGEQLAGFEQWALRGRVAVGAQAAPLGE